MKSRLLVVVAMLATAAVAGLLYVQSGSLDSPVASSGEVSPSATAPENTEPDPQRRTVKAETISMMDLAGTGVGDSFSLYIPQEDRIVSGTVSQSHFTKAGNEVLQGTIEDGDQSYGFVITIGRNQTFGSVQTRRDRYQFELADGQGELIAQSATNALRDFSEPDYVIREYMEAENIDEN